MYKIFQGLIFTDFAVWKMIKISETFVEMKICLKFQPNRLILGERPTKGPLLKTDGPRNLLRRFDRFLAYSKNGP